MANESPKKKEPTASEAMFFFAIVKHTRNKADVDWASVAQEQGFKNADVAKVRFGQVKRKLGLTTDPTASPGQASTPKKGDTGSKSSTPTKVKKPASGRVGTKGKGRGKVKKEEPVDDNEEEDPFPPTTPIREFKEEDVENSAFD